MKFARSAVLALALAAGSILTTPAFARCSVLATLLLAGTFLVLDKYQIRNPKLLPTSTTARNLS